MNYNNPAFCVLPFIHKHTRLSGENTLCCNSTLPVKPGSIDNLRQKILNGERIQHCKTCYAYEDNGLMSTRIRENTRWLADSEVKEYIDTYSTNREEIIFSYDLRHSNICNLACIGCMPQQSSMWAKELNIEIKPIHFKFGQEQLKSAKWIYLAGGEPFLVNELVDLLRTVSKQETQPLVCVNTNLTIQDDDIAEICKNLKSLTLQISFDGVGKIAEYHRWPLKWEKFKRNLEWAKSLGCNIIFNTVVDATNVAFIHEIAEYQELPNSWYLTILFKPSPLRIENLPDHLKQFAYDNFIKLKESTHYQNDINFKNDVDSIACKILEQGSPKDLSTHIQAMDSRRKINHADFLGISLV